MSPRRLLLALAVTACHAAAPRSVAPRAPIVERPALVFASEAETFAWFQEYYVDHGFPDAAKARVVVEEILIPYYNPLFGAVHVDPYLTPGFETKYVAWLSQVLLEGRLEAAWLAAYPDAAERAEAFREFFTLVSAHELAHFLRAHRGGAHGAWDYWLEETRAMDVEYAVLEDLVASGAVPAVWKDRYARTNQALMNAIPEARRREVPADGEARRRFYDDLLPAALGSLDPKDPHHPSDQPALVETYLATYQSYRLELARGEHHHTLAEAIAQELQPDSP